ncbi:MULTISPECIES: DUF982 domain-containing protein [Brucella/Ochrobactrum group]|uniref:DUF982 domain-containing protein n=1 Tax=Brucella/Ochrobactrum group TaxID=2826938 RepID=UPI00119DCFF5|nr:MULTISPECIES: DUF982 domain-containing protein [Brucella/Ochrobactrum group]KAB2679987.1 DUF982 domain-containing protein [Brucella pseudintermedia]MCO7729101.1 DUF982 domain-containing protein [Brucella intermedia]TWH03338.1 uncharacterized protein DUF982 [Ochrobactrum sp. J50]WPM82835.1 DUF982 domain-containing protein [Brucella pseudintermedia]
MPWDKPVDVQLYGIGKYRIVPDTATAARCLLNDWPENEEAHGKEYEEALQACLADLEGLPNTARESFIKAAKAAGLTIRPSQWH